MYFHNGNSKETLTFQNNECNKEFVYVTDLSSDHYLFHEDPYIFVNNDGVILGLDQQSATLGLFNNDHVLIDTYTLNFITICESTSFNQALIVEEKEVYHHKFGLFILILIMFVFIIITKKKGKHHET